MPYIPTDLAGPKKRLYGSVLVSCPAPPRTCEKEGLFRVTFLVTWGGVAPLSESLNQILERMIICT